MERPRVNSRIIKAQPILTSDQKLPPLKQFSDEWFITKWLEDWTGNDVRLAIDKHINLVDLILDNPEDSSQIVNMVKGMARKYDSTMATVTNILTWFGERRPDIYQALTERKEGIIWLNLQVEKLTQMFYG